MKTDDLEFFIRQKSLGYKTGLEIPRLNPFLINLLDETKGMEKIPQKLGTYYNHLEKESLEQVKKTTNKFFLNNFKMQDVYNINLTKHNIGNLKFEEAEELRKFLEENFELKLINPLDLPITLVKGDCMTGKVRKIVALDRDTGDLILKKPFYSGIDLGEDLNKLSSAIYAHEIMHVELENAIGYTNDFRNKELLSIFIEKVVSLYLDPSMKLLNICEKIRFLYFRQCIELFRKIELGQIKTKYLDSDLLQYYIYVESSLKAARLFDIYLEFSKDKDRKTMLSYINMIFSGKITIEDLLKIYNLDNKTFENDKVIKKRLSYF